nr:H91 [uncultured bacterium]
MICHLLTHRNQWLDTAPKFIYDFPRICFCHLYLHTRESRREIQYALFADEF